MAARDEEVVQGAEVYRLCPNALGRLPVPESGILNPYVCGSTRTLSDNPGFGLYFYKPVSVLTKNQSNVSMVAAMGIAAWAKNPNTIVRNSTPLRQVPDLRFCTSSVWSLIRKLPYFVLISSFYSNFRQF